VLVGDIITTLDGQTTETVDELLLTLHGERVGRTVALELVRGGQPISLQVTIGERS
jgi:serine protease DegQ